MEPGQKIALPNVSASKEDYAAKLDGDITTELALVDGGFTALSAASHRKRDRSIVKCGPRDTNG